MDDQDRERFVETLEEVVESSGWVLYAWVLMSNHYHFLFKTPEPNLVQGMSWFQNTWTRRFNARHRLWGHLFGGRYKAKPVEEGEYLSRLLPYIHLNPVRAGLVKRRDGLESYGWSSLEDYVKPPSKRRSWVAVERGLAELEFRDTVGGRRRHLEWLEGCVDWNKAEKAGDELPDGLSLQATFRRGWYFGSEAFRERLLKALGQDKRSMVDKRRSGYTGAQTRDHGMSEAERIVILAQEELELTDWSTLKKGDWRKGLVATLIRKRSLVDNGWLAKRLAMGTRTAVSRIMGHAQERLRKDRKVQALVRRLEKKIGEA